MIFFFPFLMKFILREIYFISEPQNPILKKTHTFIGKITFYKSVYYFHISRLQQQFKIKRKSIILTIQRVCIFCEKHKIPEKLKISRRRFHCGSRRIHTELFRGVLGRGGLIDSPIPKSNRLVLYCPI